MTTREVKIDEVDMEALADPDTGEVFTPPERWIAILVDAGLPELADELRQAQLRRELRLHIPKGDCSMTETLAKLLLRLSDAGEPAILWGRQAAPHAGREFERLLARRVLIEQAPAIEWDVCATCECGLDARPIQHIDGHAVAVCPIDHRSDLALDAEDLRSFRIDLMALVHEIASQDTK